MLECIIKFQLFRLLIWNTYAIDLFDEFEVGELLSVFDNEAVKVPTGIRDLDVLCELLVIDSHVDTAIQSNELIDDLIIFELVRTFEAGHQFVFLSSFVWVGRVDSMQEHELLANLEFVWGVELLDLQF